MPWLDEEILLLGRAIKGSKKVVTIPKVPMKLTPSTKRSPLLVQTEGPTGGSTCGKTNRTWDEISRSPDDQTRDIHKLVSIIAKQTNRNRKLARHINVPFLSIEIIKGARPSKENILRRNDTPDQGVNVGKKRKKPYRHIHKRVTSVNVTRMHQTKTKFFK
eukprot:scaffold566_cov364-Pavlova_lutheri.AAC.22